MKLFLSVILGLLAALFAAVLVGALASGPEGASALSLGGGQVGVSLASRDLPSGHVIGEEDVVEQEVPSTVASAEGLLTKRSVLGQVLIRPLVKGQAISARSLAGRGTGPEIEAMLAEGLRATTVTLSDRGPGTFVYPGSVVDVLAVFEMPSGAVNAGELVSRTVLEGVRVLAVDGYADAAELTAGGGRSGEGRIRSSRGPIITLLLTPGQAQVLQLARSLGTLSVTLRSSEDLDPVSGRSVSMTELLRYQPRAVKPQSVVVMPSGVVNPKESEGGTAPADTVDEDDEELEERLPEIEPWETTVIRGRSRTTYQFEEK